MVNEYSEISIELERLRNELNNIKLLTDLCEDGFYQRENIDSDTAGSIMECLSSMIEILAGRMDSIIVDLDKRQ